MKQRLKEEINRSRHIMGLKVIKEEKNQESTMEELYVKNIDEDTINNDNYRKVVFTGKNLQLVLMSIASGEDIGLETHGDGDQFIRIEEGIGELIIGEQTFEISDDFGFVIPAGKQHNIINTGDKPIKLYSVYAPPEHKSEIIQKTKSEE